MIAVVLHFGVMAIAAVMFVGACWGAWRVFVVLYHQPKIGE